jgi:hypothetical protein
MSPKFQGKSFPAKVSGKLDNIRPPIKYSVNQLWRHSNLIILNIFSSLPTKIYENKKVHMFSPLNSFSGLFSAIFS